jgi:short-subunit dehydrogenase
MKLELYKTFAWITGASSGIGAEIAREAAKRGANLILSGRNLPALKAVAADCTALSARMGRTDAQHHLLPFDLGDRAARAAATQQALALSGGITLLVMNAGISQRARFEEMPPEAFDRVMEIDFFAPIDIVRRVLPSFIPGQGAGIVLVSSLVGLFGAPLRSAYSSAKHALAGFGSVLRSELLDRGVSVTTVYPGYVRTGIARAALDASGKPRGIEDPKIAGGADPARVARRILDAAVAGKADLRVAFTFESHFAIFMARHFPRYFAKLSTREVGKIQRREQS